MFWNFGKLFFSFCLIVGLFFFSKWATDGFSEAKIRPSNGFSFYDEQPVDSQKVRDQLLQSYTYLGRGAQSFAFVSEDGQTVIKFFSHHRARHPLGWLAPYLPLKLKKKLNQTLQKREHRLYRDFLSAKLAATHLLEETGILYTHLDASTDLNISLKVFDKIGVVHHLPLDHMQFVVQERAMPTYETLQMWIKNGDLTLAKSALSSLVDVVRKRVSVGIYDKDPNLKTNFGFVGTRAIQFDIGRFSLEPKREEPAVQRDDLIRTFDRLERWLDGMCPELAEHLRHEVHR